MRYDPQFDRTLIAAFQQNAPAESSGIGALLPRASQPSMRVLRAVMRLAGQHAELLRHAERPWASITFSGTRHAITLAFEGVEGCAAGEAFLAALPDHEFTISRQLVADASVTSVVHDMLPVPRIVVEAELLLLDDC